MQDLLQYLVLDTEMEVTEHEETVSQLYAAAEGSDSESEQVDTSCSESNSGDTSSRSGKRNRSKEKKSKLKKEQKDFPTDLLPFALCKQLKLYNINKYTSGVFGSSMLHRTVPRRTRRKRLRTARTKTRIRTRIRTRKRRRKTRRKRTKKKRTQKRMKRNWQRNTPSKQRRLDFVFFTGFPLPHSSTCPGHRRSGPQDQGFDHSLGKRQQLVHDSENGGISILNITKIVKL